MCARCSKPGPGPRWGRVVVDSEKQQFPYAFRFCEGCMDVLHPKLGNVIGDFCQEVPVKSALG